MLEVGVGACSEPTDPVSLMAWPAASGCPPVTHASDALPPVTVLHCLGVRAIVDASNLAALDSTVAQAVTLQALYHQFGDSLRSALLDSALARLSGYYSRGLLSDSAMVNRVIDHVAVTMEYVLGTVPQKAHRFYPRRTPSISWHYYPGSGQGIFAHPVETVTALGARTPDALAGPLPDLLATGEALWRYAIWRESRDGRRFPLWLYLFKNEITDPTPGSTYFRLLTPPWRSSMPQGDLLILFTELFHRTGDPLWSQRAKAVLVSFDVPWSEGGIRLDDTTGGYWFEEAHPAVRIWNGSMQALVALGTYAREFPLDTLGTRLWNRGLAAAQQHTPEYDTGSWLLYSRVQGNIAPRYRTFYVDLARALERLTSDVVWNDYAVRWASYTPPSGPCVGGPCPQEPE